jgi:hypothetical protein
MEQLFMVLIYLIVACAIGYGVCYGVWWICVRFSFPRPVMWICGVFLLVLLFWFLSTQLGGGRFVWPLRR